MHHRPLFASIFAVLTLSLAAQEPLGVPGRRTPGGLNRPMQTSVQHLPVSAQAALTAELPPLQEGVEELKFSEFYKMPVGPRGLEPSDKLRGLDGHRVRLCGFFVFEDWSNCNCAPAPELKLTPTAARRQLAQPTWMKHVIPGRIMLSPTPVTVSLAHYGLCDDLPPQVVFVEVAPRFGEPVPYQPGIFTVTGKLTLGTKDEPDGRTSYVHLKVEREEDLARVSGNAANVQRSPSNVQRPITQATVGGPK